jgi:hypothetical protein
MKKIILIMLVTSILSCKKNEKANTEILDNQASNTTKLLENSISNNKLSFKMDGKKVECDKQIFCMSTPSSAVVQGEFGTKNRMDIGFILDKNDQPQMDKGNVIGSIQLTIDGKFYRYFEYWDESEKGAINISKIVKGVGGGGIQVKYLSGTFEGILKDDKGNKITITDGQFSSTGLK